MRGVKVNVISIIVCATGSLSVPFQKHLDDTAGKHGSMELQKTPIRGNSAHLEEDVKYFREATM